MYTEKGKYRLSTAEIASGVLGCPKCDSVLEPAQTTKFHGFKCLECKTKVQLSSIVGLPDAHAEAFTKSQAFIEKVESLKGVVDELHARGDKEDAYALSNLITAWLPPSEIVVPAHVVEACRLLDIAENTAKSAALASRISALRLEIQKEIQYGNSKLRKSQREATNILGGLQEEDGDGTAGT